MKTNKPKRQESHTIKYTFKVFVDPTTPTITTKNGGCGLWRRQFLRISINDIDIFNGIFRWRDWSYTDSFENGLLAKLAEYFKIDIRRRILKRISKKKEIRSIHKLPFNLKLLNTEKISIEGIITNTVYTYSVEVWYFYETILKKY